MHRSLDDYPPAPEWREQRAAEIVPYKTMAAEEYVVREAHNWVCFSDGEYIYSDRDLNEWGHSLDDIFFTRGAVEAARKNIQQEIR